MSKDCMSTMELKIESRNNFASGAYLVTAISQNNVDKNALYTITADLPKFMLPFTYTNIDGEVEIVYEVGNLVKLSYFKGELSTDEYVGLWISLLQPLLECGDWFLNSSSFVLNMDYLYYDKKEKSAMYMYVPAIEGNASKSTWGEMAKSLSKIITVSDKELENRVLRYILDNFTPREFLEMLKDYTAQNSQQALPHTSQHISVQNSEPCSFDESIDIGFLPISADLSDEPEIKSQRTKEKKFRMFGTKSKKKNRSKDSSEQCDNELPQVYEIPIIAEKTIDHPQEQITIIDITESIPFMLQKTRFKCVGKSELPQLIDVEIGEGDIFSIGRYDAALGKPQSTFEFDKKTKAVSRRHAVIERDIEGYKLIDLCSRAGTFIDGQKLPPNTPYQLAIGTRVSFGNFGADYVWDVG
ncbi:MAG: FHA domain-containing protein [Oscillospiraceae bacterium]|nr:FHA domain-containing protein [Oscillospiraceae bacterium]